MHEERLDDASRCAWLGAHRQHVHHARSISLPTRKILLEALLIVARIFPGGEHEARTTGYLAQRGPRGAVSSLDVNLPRVTSQLKLSMSTAMTCLPGEEKPEAASNAEGAT